MIKWLKVLHYIGSLMMLFGGYLLLFTQTSQQIDGMMVVASLIGLGLLMMAPYPVALVIEWSHRQQKQQQITIKKTQTNTLDKVQPNESQDK
ncbi:hypothetical protein [Shewanella aestuarii]|uniref:hypothetical protein n=1 Tax=Shewanella aestuarii TaxID=1028752 RepID=UPI001ABF7F01|nr:hypothetical protein [Shewanella aestuarii]